MVKDQQQSGTISDDNQRALTNKRQHKRLKAESSKRFVRPKLVPTCSSDSGSLSDIPTSKKRKIVNFKTRTSPNGLFSLIRNLTQAQKEAVQAVGFGSLLSLGISKCPYYLCKYVCTHFDVLKRSIVLPNGDEIQIDEDFVYDVLKIPKGQIDVVESIGQDSADSDYQAFLLNWRTRWGANLNKRRPESNDILRRLIESEYADNDFKIDFVVYVVSTFLWSLQHSRARFKILKALMDVDNIKNLNWCKFTLTALVESAKKWKQNDQAFFEGPLTFLLLCYLDRFVVEGVPQPIRRTIPIISCWDDMSLAQRNVAESRFDGFARGRVRELTTILEEEDAHVGEPQEAAKEATLEEAEEEMLDSGSSTAPNNEEILKSKVDEMFNQIDKLYLSGEFEKNNIDPYPIFEARMKIFTETDLYKRFINEMGYTLNEEAPLNQYTPEKVSEDDVSLNTPKTLEIVPFTVPEPMLNIFPIKVECPPCPTPCPPPERLIVINKGKGVVACKNVELPLKRRLKKTLPSVLKSPYVRNGGVVSKIIGEVLPIEQQMADIVFNGGPELDVLFKCTLYDLTRRQLNTLKENMEVENSVIDIFTRLLNRHFQSLPKHTLRKICFSTTSFTLIGFGERLFVERLSVEMDELWITKEDIDNADLIFFPTLYSNHYYIVCLNMTTKHVEILDNRPLPKGITFKDKYVTVPEHLDLIYDWLIKIDSTLAVKMKTFKRGSIRTAWQDSSNITCCGVYCMRHLETYNGLGNKWQCGITLKNSPEALKKLRIKYIHRILSSKFNEIRDDIFPSQTNVSK